VKSPCDGWLRFLVGQKRSSSCHVILNSCPISPVYFLHLWKCWYRVFWNILFSLNILKVIFLIVIHFGLKKLFLFNYPKKRCRWKGGTTTWCYRKCWPKQLWIKKNQNESDHTTLKMLTKFGKVNFRAMFWLNTINFSQKSPHFSLWSSTSPR
jgi:hypothetical protein